MPDCGTDGGYQAHVRGGKPVCLACRVAHNQANTLRKAAKVANPRLVDNSWDLWPGIMAGGDARCSCTWAPLNGVYQVKVRDALCVNHGGALASVLARVARWPPTYGSG